MTILIFIIAIIIVSIIIGKNSDKGNKYSNIHSNKNSEIKYNDAQTTNNTSSKSSQHAYTGSYNERSTQSFSHTKKSGYVIPTIEQLSKKAKERGEDYITEINFEVKGLYYRGSRAIYEAEQLEKGDVLNLVPEPNNPADRFAIKVHTENDVFIGYIPKECSEELTRNHDKHIDCYVRYVKQGYDAPYVKATARYYVDNYEYGDDYTDVIIHKLKDYMSPAIELKRNEKWQEAAEAFLIASEKEHRFEDQLKACMEACICFRKMKEYDREIQTINRILSSFSTDLSQSKYDDLKKRLETAQKFKDSKDRKKSAMRSSKKGKMIAEIIDSLYFHQINK